jgi:hypothetical protein
MNSTARENFQHPVSIRVKDSVKIATALKQYIG